VSERDITEDDVPKEHLGEVNTGGHWAYLAAVLLVGFGLMVGLIAWLDASPT
jgi:hypothetical protein